MIFCCFGTSKERGYSHEHSECFHYNNVRLFSYKELKLATNNFHSANRLGKGGFGVVHKGILKDGFLVAVKSLLAESRQGAREFLTEINTISSITHPNLVQLIGCCVDNSHHMLIYEYLPNNSLASALFGPKSKQIDLNWAKRASICIGTAHGLAYLHEEAEPPIVHRDIKASNILLDNDFLPKIGDFGIAKLFPDNITHISTRVAGTEGYLAPEYALLGQLTKKADIYSFGVLVLEILSGRSSAYSECGEDMMLLVEWTWELRKEGRLLEIVDPALDVYSPEEALRFIKVALFCTQAFSQKRPSMKQIVEMLETEMSFDETSLEAPTIKNLVQYSRDAGCIPQVSEVPEGKISSKSTGFSLSSVFTRSSLTVTEMGPR